MQLKIFGILCCYRTWLIPFSGAYTSEEYCAYWIENLLCSYKLLCIWFLTSWSGVWIEYILKLQDVENELAVQVSMKHEIELAMKLLEKDIHEKQDTLIGLRQQLEEVKSINIEMYQKLQVRIILKFLEFLELTGNWKWLFVWSIWFLKGWVILTVPYW